MNHFIQLARSVRRRASSRCCLLLALLSPLAGGACVYVPSQPGGVSTILAAEAAPWSFAGVSGERFTTAHYRIYTTADNRALLTQLPGFMEAAHAQYLQLTGLGERDDGKGSAVYLLGDRRQWGLLTEEMTGPMSRLYLRVENGGFCYEGKCVLWDMGHFATFSVAAHEGMHQFLYRRMKDGLPAWAEEGLCTQAEGFEMTDNLVRFAPGKNILRLADLRNAIASGRWMGAPALLTTEPGEQVQSDSLRAPEYYGQLWALVGYIRSVPRYRAGLENMLADGQAGKLPGPPMPASARVGRQFRRAIALPAFKQYIEQDLPAFETGFRQYANKLARFADKLPG